jgi:chemotaxis protein MotB
MGASIMALPANTAGRALGDALKTAISLFTPEIENSKISVTYDERGLVITLAGDMFFNPASARINVEQSRDILLRLASMLDSDALNGRKFRIEGHTDDTAIDPDGPWTSNWELSADRAIAVLQYLSDLGVDENRFQVAGFGSTEPLASNDTPEGRAYNRRVDIIVLNDGNL